MRPLKLWFLKRFYYNNSLFLVSLSTHLVVESASSFFFQQNYKKPDSMNLRNLYMHLTNYSLNKNSDKFKKADSNFMNGSDNSSK